MALIAIGSARKNSPFTRLFLTRFCSGRMGHSTYPYRMMVQMKAATSTATMGRLAAFEQVAFNIDHSGLMENTKAASAICDLVSKARILDSANTIELLRNSIRSAGEGAGGWSASPPATAAIGSLRMVTDIARGDYAAAGSSAQTLKTRTGRWMPLSVTSPADSVLMDDSIAECTLASMRI